MIINRIVNDHLIENAQVSGAYLLQAARWFKGVFLGGHKNKSVTDDVRGLGTMIAVDNKRYQPPITLKKVDVETMIRERVLEVLKNKLARANQLPNEFSHRKEASDIIQGLNDFTPFNEFLSEATKARTLLAEVDDYSIPLFPNK